MRQFALTLCALGSAVLLAGCGNRAVEQALTSDANGYLCLKCSAKFYTAREVFPGHCHQCKAPNLDQVLGFNCAADQHVTLGPRGRGFRACEQCGKTTTALSLPRENELKAWGATKKSNAEVN